MRNFLLCFLWIAPFCANAYDKNQITLWLQQQAYSEILSYTPEIPEGEQDVFLWNSAGYAAWQLTQKPLAFQYFQKTLSQDSTNYTALLYSALYQKEMRQYATALGFIDQLIAVNPARLNSYTLGAECYEALGKKEEALLMLRQGNGVDPLNAKIAAGYADLLLEEAAFSKADAVLQKALHADSANSLLLTTAVKAAFLQQYYQQALYYSDRLLAAGYISYAPMYYATVSALRLENFQRALQLCELLIETGYETEQILYYAAKAHAGLKQYEQSNELLQRCLKKSISENAETYYAELGSNLEALGQPGKAVAYYDTAYYLFKNPGQLYASGNALVRSNKKEAARKRYRQYLKQPAKTNDSTARQFVREWLKGEGG